MNNVEFWEDEDCEYMSYFDNNGEYHVTIIKAWFDDYDDE